MASGGGWLLTGAAGIGFSVCWEPALRQMAVETIRASRGNPAFLFGILAVIIGMVLLAVDSGPPPLPDPAVGRELEKLREEVERLKRQQGQP